MNAKISLGIFCGLKRFYRSKDGRHYFNFEFVNRGSRVDVFCNNHPPLNGRRPDPHKTHLYRSGKLCFAAGREPRTQARAEQLARQWAEHFVEYRRTGRA